MTSTGDDPTGGDRRDGPAPGSAPLERWAYDDDELGRVEVVVGRYEHLRRLDPGWPGAKAVQDSGAAGPADAAGEPAPSGSGTSDWNRQPGDLAAQWAARSASCVPGLAGRARELADNGEKGVLVTVGGKTVARCRTVTSHRAALDGTVKDGKFSDYPATSSERVQIRANGLTHEVLEVHLHHKRPGGREIVALAPPPGSRGERRAAEMEASPWKRLVYPLAGGFGKAGVAVAMLLLIPLIGRLVGWLWGLFEPHVPEFEIPWPDWDLPSIPWSDWDLPSIPWPDIDLPDVTLPGWVQIVMDYQKIWVPILIGLVVGVIAWRRQKRARRADRPEERGQVSDEVREPDEPREV